MVSAVWCHRPWREHHGVGAESTNPQGLIKQRGWRLKRHGKGRQMILVHEEPKEIQREFGRVMENCEFCRTPTRFWTEDAKHSVCPTCAETHNPDELKL